MRVHDRVLSTPQYRQAFDLANQLAARVEQTWLYSTARARLPASAVETGEHGWLRGTSMSGGLRGRAGSAAWLQRQRDMLGR